MIGIEIRGEAKLDGLDRVIAGLDKLVAINKAGAATEKTLKKIAVKRTGRLRKSIAFQKYSPGKGAGLNMVFYGPSYFTGRGVFAKQVLFQNLKKEINSIFAQRIRSRRASR